MKHLIYLTAVISVSVGVCAQGTVNFNNSKGAIGGNGAKVTYWDPGVGLDSSFVAQLWAGPDGSSLAPVGAVLAFRDGAGRGFLNTTGQDTVRVISTVVPGGIATIQIRVWEAAKGSTFQEALFNASVMGMSAIFTVKTGGDGEPASLPANLVGLQPFSVVPNIPEPSTVALGALGLGALLWRRRA